jgi:hypothetical protein
MSDTTNGEIFHFSQHPYNQAFQDLLEIKFELKKIDKQSISTQASDPVQLSSQNTFFIFEAPAQMVVQLSHTWAEYESIATRAAGFWSSANVLLSDLYGTGKGIADFITKTIGTNREFSDAKEVIASARSANIIGSHGVLYNRVDSPLVYRYTERLQYLLNFDIAWWDNAYNQVFKGIQKFMKYTCPSTTTDQIISVNAPYVFTVTSTSKNSSNTSNPLIKVDCAVVEQVNVTWREPYSNGYPTNASVQIQIKDIQPTYSWQFDGSSNPLITTSSVGGSTS